ncbi:adenosylhomocysteinase [Flavonifractor sp. DFI.6.63]|uniref:Adenosylhomocysteinase n=1 Tax=Lawsonibacter hominis TaxID=2763053 RepID=A0A8J6JFV0_9FIRM|nr:MULTISPECIES: adenosylhomocysteinase [Oscillospiraceae]MBS1384981.1 adenosylhomocysteinase [Flavonifractor sp.]MDU2195341.1 adenosylhomocysteinase [Clostridiales bacterium]MDY2976903.1 adenosylhomocysteinase [Oscillospiraceae bacterium]MBC5734035.1 adenosylhomocysteinase [Lawsonibacter hominis]MCI6398668.1 adenosylhomocysteinase [Lawsonibacter sp.]
MSILKDQSLAESGRRKIRWVRDFMPALGRIEERFAREQPFAGLRIAVSVHLEAKTANLGYVLQKGGAQVRLTGSNPLSTQDDVAAGLASMGVETFGVHGASAQEYERHLIETLKVRPHLIVDDGGDLVHLLGGKCAQLGENLIGGCEETTTGILRLRAREREGILPCPMMAVNDARAKHYYDNKYGTGQSVWDAIMHTTNLVVAGKTVVVAGYGWCGKGVAMRAKGMGADVVVCEVDPFKALDATMNGFRVMPMDEAARCGDVFVTVTGCKDVITPRHFAVMKHNALLTNAGHFDCEVDVAGLAAMAVGREVRRENIEGYTLPDGRVLNVLGEGRLVNLAAGNGHPAEIMDMSFAVQALALEWLVRHRQGLERKVYQVPDEIDEEIGRVKLAALGLAIDALTPEQQAYLNGWKAE